MGAKTGVLAFVDGDAGPLLRQRPVASAELTPALIERLYPGYRIEPDGQRDLWEAVYPPDDMVYALSVPGLDLACDQRFMVDRPSELPAHLLQLGAGRRMLLHAMHSVVDWLAFAIWDDGVLVRSLSLSPGEGIMENIGAPLPFEESYWAGAHPVEPIPGWPAEGPYPLPFHPLELGEDALRHLFGFVLEGRPEPNDVPAHQIGLPGFRVTDPTGAEQARREASLQAVRKTMGQPRFFQYRDGRMVEVSLDDL
jgi:hypothetical protein